MSARNIEINISSKTEPMELIRFWGGMQYEDNSTKIIFLLGDLEDENRLFRIDFNSTAAGYHPSKNLTAEDGKIERSIPKYITQYGGEIQVTAVITNENNEVLYSYPVTVYFTDVEKADSGDNSVEGNISEMEQTVRNLTDVSVNSADAALLAAAEAENNRNATEQAKFSLEHGAEFVFVGGDAEQSSLAELVIDSEMSDESGNTVKNCVIKEYVDNSFERQGDYVTEHGTHGAWFFRKWQSGLVELWGHSTVSTLMSEVTCGSFYLGLAFEQLVFPFELIGNVHIHPSVSSNSLEYITLLSSSAEDGKTPIYTPVSPVPVSNNVNIELSVYVVGRWK